MIKQRFGFVKDKKEKAPVGAFYIYSLNVIVNNI